MNQYRYIALATFGSFALLLGAFAFQHLGGLAPCKMCIWQRYPHALAVLIGLVAMRIHTRILIVLGALCAAVSGGVGLFHAGVEQGWWEGPSTCSSGPVGDISAQDLLNQILAAPLVRCDEIAWSLLGVSMAGWNALISVALVGVWLMAFKRA